MVGYMIESALLKKEYIYYTLTEIQCVLLH